MRWKTILRSGERVLVTDKMDETEEKVLLGAGTDVMVDPVFHTPGARNIADLGTRGKAKIEDIQAGSEWQSGPAYRVSTNNLDTFVL